MGKKELKEAFEAFERVKNHKNIFLSNNEDILIFDDFIEDHTEIIRQNSIFYRARIHSNKEDTKPFRESNIGMPKNIKCRNGRVNPEGKNVFYLAGSKDTAIAEVRAAIKDKITIGTFKSDSYLKVIKLTNNYTIITGNKVRKSEKDDDFFLYFATYFNLYFSKEVREEEKESEYRLTQLFAQYCEEKNFDGIAYPSSIVKECDEEDYGSKDIKPDYNYVFFKDDHIHWETSELIII